MKNIKNVDRIHFEILSSYADYKINIKESNVPRIKQEKNKNLFIELTITNIMIKWS